MKFLERITLPENIDRNAPSAVLNVVTAHHFKLTARITAMIGISPRVRLCALIAVLVFRLSGIDGSLAKGIAQQPQVADDRPFAFQTSSTVDPNLFALYALWSIYQTVPAAAATPQDHTQWISTSKYEAQRWRAIVREDKLDPSLDRLYSDCLSFAAAYENYLETVVAIHKRRQGDESGDVISGIGTGAQRGSDAKDLASTLGADDKDASSVGTFAALIAGLSKYSEQSNQHDAAEKAAVNAQLQKLTDAYNGLKANAQVTTERMAQVHGWQRTETGFDGPVSGSLYASSVQMPRNPFAANNLAITLNGKERPEDLTHRAMSCFQAAEMVPSGEEFDDYRNVFLYNAAYLAVDAASIEAGPKGYTAVPASNAPLAIHMVNTYLSLNTKDPGGRGNFLLGRALAMEGRYSEGIEAENRAFQIEPSIREDTSTVLRYSYLLCVAGQVDSSAQWLQKAYRLGFNDVATIRNIPEFANLQRLRPALYAQLTTAILTKPQFVWGLILDDAIVENRSPFDLTNVLVQVIVHKQGRNYPFTMKCPMIKAGQACRVDNVVTIPGDSYDDIQASFSSDQTS